MEIIKLGNPILRQISEDVRLPLSKEDRDLMTSLYKYVKDNEELAMGISAVQVGILKRMCAIRYRKHDNSLVSYQLVNPKIIWHSQEKYSLEGGEGCLSVEETHDDRIPRWSAVRVMAFDCIKNKSVLIDATGLDAVVLQHELDHLNGILYIDYIK